MKKTVLTIILMLGLCLAASAQVTFSGSDHDVLCDTPSITTGLNAIYVIYDADDVSMSYTASTDRTVTWYSYGELGGGYAQEMTGVVTSGRTTTLSQVVPNQGYIIEEGTDRTYLWVVNYSSFFLHLEGVSVDEATDCGTVTLHLTGSGNDIVYYDINGVRRVLNRGMTVQYNTLEWNDTVQSPELPHWQESPQVETEEGFRETIVLQQPLCRTVFTVGGDRFLKQWGEAKPVESDEFKPIAVDCRATAVQESRDNPNEKKSGDDSSLGGSAPCHITFTGYPTDAVVYRAWQRSYDPEFNTVDLTYNQDVVDETFNDAGVYYWRYMVADASGNCEAYSDVYTVNIGVSELVCPNVFSPGTTEGVNDVWMVSYKSIVEFHCWIFNKWGNLVAELTDPSQGWDGTYKGKTVGAGVYYYVLRATGSDGKKYELDGDINVIRWKQNPHYSGGSSTGGTTGE